MVSAMYGLLTGAVLLTALLSDSETLQKVAMWLLVSWTGSNLAVNVMGFDHAPLVVPTLDAIVAIGVGVIGYAHRSRSALTVFLLFLLTAAVHVAAFVSRREATYPYYAALNLLFLAQLLSVGVPGAWLAVHRRTTPRRERARSYPARR